MAPKRVVIVGAGITGLVAAYDLERQTNAEITIVEREFLAGGKIKTLSHRDFSAMEAGADCFFTHKKGALEFIEEIGLSHLLQEPSENKFSMLIGGKLRQVPRGLLSFGAIDSASLDEADFLSEEAKDQVRNEKNAPIGLEADESVAAFFRRRFGREFSRVIAEPLLAGTHAGDAETLSMAALYPNYLDAERKYGSLSAAPRPEAAPGRPSFLSFKGGMAMLPITLYTGFSRAEVLYRANVGQVRPGEVVTDRGKKIQADHILLTVPAWAAADMLGVESLRAINHASSAIVTLGFEDRFLAGLVGTGFLVPPSEPAEITGATWSSQKWEGRASPGHKLVRVFIGRAGGFDVTLVPDTSLVAMAMRSLARVVEVTGPAHMSEISRWHRGLPQYEIGHLEKLSRIEEEMHRLPRVHLAGASYRGVGIPDCIRQGREAAQRIMIEMA